MIESILAAPVIGPILGTLLPFLLVLSVVIFVHEYGHYIVGRWCGIHAEAFSIGFGREVFGWTDRRGTRWKLSWIPLGGYVRFRGDADAAGSTEEGALEGMSEAERRKTMPGAPLWARAATVAAGPVANFLLTMALIAGVSLAMGRPSAEPVIGSVSADGQAAAAGLRAGDRILSVDGAPVGGYGDFLAAMLDQSRAGPRQVTLERGGAEQTFPVAFAQATRIADVRPDGPAAQACLAPGDVIRAIDGRPVRSFAEIQDAVGQSDGKALNLTIERGATTKDVTLTPELLETPDPETGQVERRLLIGVTADFNIGLAPERERMGVGEALLAGLTAPLRIAGATFGYIGAIFDGRADGSSLGGPLGIADASGRAAAAGFASFVLLIAALSTAIGLINLFPIPVLDGGHLLFFSIEAVRGKPLGEAYVNAAMTAGFIAIIALMVFATSNDVPRIFGGLAAGC